MTGQKKKFIDIDDFYSFNTGSSVSKIILKPFEYMSLHASGLVSGTQTLSLQGVVQTEVAFASFTDISGNVGKYTIDPVTNSVVIGVDPVVVTSSDLAKSWITGFVIIYDMIPLKYYSSDSELFLMKTYYSNGVYVGATDPTSLESINTKIIALDDDINVNDVGYYIHYVNKALIAV